jgi:hypothetical protein
MRIRIHFLLSGLQTGRADSRIYALIDGKKNYAGFTPRG